MVNTLKIFEDLKDEIGESAARKMAEILGKLYEEIQRSMEREEFENLRKAVTELALAQKGAEERISRLEETMRELIEAQKALTEAQKRSEERISRLEETVRELAEAQKRSEERISRLEETVRELAEAQKRSEERISRLEETMRELIEAQKALTEAQKRSEERISRLEETVRELAEAQRRTEEELRQLVREHREMRRQLGGLSITFGYTLENQAFIALPRLLKRDYGITVEGRIRRQYVMDSEGKYIEMNIIGVGLKDDRRVTIVGEGKSQLSKKDVDNFIKRKLRRVGGVFEDIFPVLVTHMISEPDVEEYANEKGIKVYYSYDFME